MADISRLYLDTNVFIAMAEGADELSSALYDLVASQVADEQFLCTSELAPAELLVKPYRDGNDPLIQLYDSWITPGGWLEVGPVERSVLWYAAVVRQQYRAIKLPDAIHVSTAIGMQSSHYLTGDKGLPEELNLVHTRWGMTRGPARLGVVRLSVESVKKIAQERKS
jgi:predicted nucleic acid-binding protein